MMVHYINQLLPSGHSFILEFLNTEVQFIKISCYVHFNLFLLLYSHHLFQLEQDNQINLGVYVFPCKSFTLFH